MAAWECQSRARSPPGPQIQDAAAIRLTRRLNSASHSSSSRREASGPQLRLRGHPRFCNMNRDCKSAAGVVEAKTRWLQKILVVASGQATTIFLRVRNARRALGNRIFRRQPVPASRAAGVASADRESLLAMDGIVSFGSLQMSSTIFSGQE